MRAHICEPTLQLDKQALMVKTSNLAVIFKTILFNIIKTKSVN